MNECFVMICQFFDWSATVQLLSKNSFISQQFPLPTSNSIWAIYFVFGLPLALLLLIFPFTLSFVKPSCLNIAYRIKSTSMNTSPKLPFLICSLNFSSINSPHISTFFCSTRFQLFQVPYLIYKPTVTNF